jgi:hypothetical protein
MRFLAMICVPSQDMEKGDPAVIDRHLDFTREAIRSGAYVTCDALASPAAAVTVRVRDGRVLRTDGPFAETREVIGGFYMLECPDIEQAVALAARIPGADTGCIEVRPINVIPGWDDAVARMRPDGVTA